MVTALNVSGIAGPLVTVVPAVQRPVLPLVEGCAVVRAGTRRLPVPERAFGRVCLDDRPQLLPAHDSSASASSGTEDSGELGSGVESGGGGGSTAAALTVSTSSALVSAAASSAGTSSTA